METEKIIMHYLDDDVKYIQYFKEAVHSTDKPIVLHTYTKSEELMRNIEVLDDKVLILLDINMPRKNGFEVLKEIREKEKTKGLPVVVCSTITNETAINISRDLGASLYVVKPNNVNDLRFVVETISGINWEKHDNNGDTFLVNLQTQ